jgi:hypothetical protein
MGPADYGQHQPVADHIVWHYARANTGFGDFCFGLCRQRLNLIDVLKLKGGKQPGFGNQYYGQICEFDEN